MVGRAGVRRPPRSREVQGAGTEKCTDLVKDTLGDLSQGSVGLWGAEGSPGGLRMEGREGKLLHQEV